MKSLILAIYVLILSVNTAVAKDIVWSFQHIQFKGERALVLSLTDSLQEIYITPSGERLIHYLKESKPEFILAGGLGNLQLITTSQADGALIISGQDYELEDLYRILLLIYENQEGLIPAQIELDHFLAETVDFQPSEESYDEFITLFASHSNLNRMKSVLKAIRNTKVGNQLFQDMKKCDKKLLIVDDKHALSGGGYAGAIQTGSAIFDGRGADARVRFRFDQPDAGSHLVYTVDREQIPFSFIDNIYHELVHAKHIMCGTMSRFSSEHQAIDEENNFRKERLNSTGPWQRDPSKYEDGQQVWFGLYL